MLHLKSRGKGCIAQRMTELPTVGRDAVCRLIASNKRLIYRIVQCAIPTREGDNAVRRGARFFVYRLWLIPERYTAPQFQSLVPVQSRARPSAPDLKQRARPVRFRYCG